MASVRAMAWAKDSGTGLGVGRDTVPAASGRGTGEHRETEAETEKDPEQDSVSAIPSEAEVGTAADVGKVQGGLTDAGKATATDATRKSTSA